MILSDKTLMKMIKSEEILVDPIGEHSIQPASIDLRLGEDFLIMEEHGMNYIDLDVEIKYREIIGKSVTIPPHSFLLATTKEYIRLPANITAFVEGRSSIGRIGLFIQNAGWVDPGFEGNITLELFNASPLPIMLKAGKRICQLVFCMMDGEANNPYRGKYQGQNKTTGSRIHKDK